jgi:hypothetical protein
MFDVIRVLGMIFKFFIEKRTELFFHTPQGSRCFFFDNIFGGFVKKICHPFRHFNLSLTDYMAYQEVGIILTGLLDGIAIGAGGFIRQICGA